MTFALTSFFADGVRFSGPGPYRAVQQYKFEITAAATDVDLDVGDATGTFWTAAQANSTYGTMATNVLTFIESASANYSSVENIFMPELYDRPVKVASSPTGTQYVASINSTSLLPDFEFSSTGGETTYTLHVRYMLDPNMPPNNISYNIS